MSACLWFLKFFNANRSMWKYRSHLKYQCTCVRPTPAQERRASPSVGPYFKLICMQMRPVEAQKDACVCVCAYFTKKLCVYRFATSACSFLRFMHLFIIDADNGRRLLSSLYWCLSGHAEKWKVKIKMRLFLRGGGKLPSLPQVCWPKHTGCSTVSNKSCFCAEQELKYS